ncbi:hypothetical protein PAPHI01_2751 [Pancytospora philotis]|nr:hypothetical protein PAPHI01_2751 [Pancytospora philotis]
METLRSGLTSMLKKKRMNLKKVFLQQDNDPKHTSKKAKTYYK